MRVSPFLSMLLAKKRPTDDIPYDDPNDPIPESVDAGPTIPIRRIPQVVTPIAAETRTRTTGVSTGLTDPGNLNPYNRTVLKNPDGSISTTSSTGVGTDKGETIIPTVVDGVRLTPEQALLEFRKTGGNFGSYGTVEQGDTAATALHNDQAAYLAKNGIGTNGNDTRARTVTTLKPRSVPTNGLDQETLRKLGTEMGIAMPAGQIEDAGLRLPASTEPTIPIKPRGRVEDAADVVRKYDQGLHPDPKTGEWVPHHRNKGLEIFEGLSNVAASGVGINLQTILHPRGTPEQQARQRLADESAIEGQNIQRTKAASDIAGDTATAAWRTAEAERLRREASDPRQTPAAKAKAEAIKTSLGLHPQPFDLTNPDDRELLAAAKEQGIIINPDTYGEKDESGKSVQFAEEMTPDGRKRKIQYNPKTKSWEPSKGATGDVITDVPKPPDEVPDTAGPIGELERQFRENAAKAQTAAETAEAKLKQYVADRKNPDYPGYDINYDPKNDNNATALHGEVVRQRTFAKDQLKHADDLAVKKVEAGNKANTQRGKGRQHGSPAPTTHSFSIGEYIKRNKGATEANARAFAALNYPGFTVRK